MTLCELLAVVGIVSVAAGKECSSLPPGLSRLRHGVDVTSLDLLPLELATSSRDGFRKPVIDFTCDKEHTWTDRQKNTYDRPDQVWDIVDVAASWSIPRVNIYKSSDEVKKSMAVKVGLGQTFRSGMFSSSASYQKTQNTISKSSKYIEEVSAYDSAVKVDLVPAFGIQPSTYFLQMVEKLPANFTSNPTPYFSFISYFGTHYFSSGNLGGMIKLDIETKSSYYGNKTTDEIERLAKGVFNTIVNAAGGIPGYSSVYNTDQTFLKSSSQALRYFGGDTSLLSQGLTAWQSTISTDPWLVSGELAPISDFINDSAIKSSMNQAVTAYLNKAYLHEVERFLMETNSFTWNLDQIQTLLTNVRTEMAQVEPSQKAVDGVSQQLKDILEVPAWFTDDLQFCLKWYADGDAGQCGNGADKLLCAAPGNMTSKYRDDSDERQGGCVMSWGLIPKRNTQPQWFHSVQICYRWFADGDADQCSSATGSTGSLHRILQGFY